MDAPLCTRLIAIETCCSYFQAWGSSDKQSKQLLLSQVRVKALLDRDQEYVLRQYDAFISIMRRLLQHAHQPLAVQTLALDSLIIMASVETCSSALGSSLPNPKALDAPNGAYRHALCALAHSCSRARPFLLSRLADRHMVHLDASFFLMKHVCRLSRLKPPQAPPRAERLLDLLLLANPPPRDVEPGAASFLMPASKSEWRDGMIVHWPIVCRQLLSHRRHSTMLCRAWRALLSHPLPPHSFRLALTKLPERVLPRVQRPLAYCDFLTGGYACGGVDAILALSGLYVLMSHHGLEYPQFYPKLVNMLTLSTLCGSLRTTFANELFRFTTSSGLPAYIRAAFVKRLGRLTLYAPPFGVCLSCGLTYNLMLQATCLGALIHRCVSASRCPPLGELFGPGKSEDVAVTSAAAVLRACCNTDSLRRNNDAMLDAISLSDPYSPINSDLEACRADGAPLREFYQLCLHYSPSTVSLTAHITAPMGPGGARAIPADLGALASLTYVSLRHLEVCARPKSAPLMITTPNVPGSGNLDDRSRGLPRDSAGAGGSCLVAGFAKWW